MSTRTARRPTPAEPVLVEGESICCRWCRQEDRNMLLHHNNHGAPHGLHWGICLAQTLTRNHVTYYVKQLATPADRRALSDVDDARQNLARCIDRATELWAHMPDTAWLDDARCVLASSAPPEAPTCHADLTTVEQQGTLW